MSKAERCEVCGKKIKMMSQKNTPWCCGKCEKKGRGIGS